MIRLALVIERLERSLAEAKALHGAQPESWDDQAGSLDLRLQRLVAECRHAADEADDERLILLGSPRT